MNSEVAQTLSVVNEFGQGAVVESGATIDANHQFQIPQATTVQNLEARVQIQDTAIVLLALVVVLVASFMVGRVPSTGSLHPVWQVIDAMCAAGMLGFSARLARLGTRLLRSLHYVQR
jgi:hypothetical protein